MIYLSIHPNNLVEERETTFLGREGELLYVSAYEVIEELNVLSSSVTRVHVMWGEIGLKTNFHLIIFPEQIQYRDDDDDDDDGDKDEIYMGSILNFVHVI